MLQHWAKAGKSQTRCAPWEQRRVGLSGFKASLDYIAGSKRNENSLIAGKEVHLQGRVPGRESAGIREGRRDSRQQ